MRIMSVKRELGEKPERSGHCNQGVRRGYPLYVFTYEKGRHAMICKPGNLLVPYKVEASEQSFPSNHQIWNA